ncbi:ATPase domain-containing protein [Opitutus terrae]|uniref:RecA-superfamily ATPase-like protein n=1 Tax=Opitutus terrae (strain DSM 11246 / JCM 15787 / PB90-1) TaxID=452637 RepID=B1ZP22_OPITP|nr:ATPase domain-containing protein [Opitutus terrae]ACB77508.1 RecA-superfamily ATPase-like protein [Opitutus terrae PB90-1]
MADQTPTEPPQFVKAPTGIAGFDDITRGGGPRGGPKLVCCAAGCGKSLMAIEFLVRGTTPLGEPGVLVTFAESAGDITKNVSSLRFDLSKLIWRKRRLIDHVRTERSKIEENGEYEVEGLFIRIGYAIDHILDHRVSGQIFPGARALRAPQHRPLGLRHGQLDRRRAAAAP